MAMRTEYHVQRYMLLSPLSASTFPPEACSAPYNLPASLEYSPLLLVLIMIDEEGAGGSGGSRGRAEVGSITRAKGIASFEAIKDHARRKKERLVSSSS